MEGGRVRNGVQPIERVGKVDQPALLADRGDRVAEAHPARDLLLEEEPDHLALVERLHLLSRNDQQIAGARERDGFERSPEHVVVGDGDAAEADPLCVVEKLCGRNRAVM